MIGEILAGGPADRPANDYGRPDAAALRRMQQVLGAIGDIPGVSVHMKPSGGPSIAVMKGGSLVSCHDPVSEDAPSGSGSVSSFHLEDGARIVVEETLDRPATAKLVAAVLRSAMQALEAEKREELLLQELGSNWGNLEVLYEISTDALRSGDIKDALPRLIERLAVLHDGLHSTLFIKREGVFHPLISSEPEVSALTSDQLGLVEKAMLEVRVVLVNRLGERSADQRPHERACWRSASSVAAAPFSWQGCVGFMVVWSENPACVFDPAFSRVLEAIAYQVSVMMVGDRLNRKVRESELLAQEVEIASTIQQTLLLANPPTGSPYFEVASCSLPSQRIDGDFHDFFQLRDGSLDVLIGDVMGKGVAAALLGAATKSQFLRATANLALGSEGVAPRPAEIVARAASRLSERLISLDRFVTLCYARFDIASQQVLFIDCGHTGILTESKSRTECQSLSGTDLALGVLHDTPCDEGSAPFRSGETYLFYSDGVTENRSPDGELFGLERLAECVQNWSSLGPAKLVAQIRNEAVRFKGSAKFSDDFTCIAVKIKSNEEPRPVAEGSAVFAPDTQELGRLRAWLRSHAEVAGSAFGEDDLARLELSCTELFTNCVLHACDGPAEQPGLSPVQFDVRILPHQAIVEMRHREPEFDPLAIAAPAFDGSKDCGFGMYIVLRSVDDLRFSREPDGTTVVTLSILCARDPKL